MFHNRIGQSVDQSIGSPVNRSICRIKINEKEIETKEKKKKKQVPVEKQTEQKLGQKF